MCGKWSETALGREEHTNADANAGRSCLTCNAPASVRAAPSSGLIPMRAHSSFLPRAAAGSHGHVESLNPACHGPPQELVILDNLFTRRLRLATIVEHGAQPEDRPWQHPDCKPVCFQARRRRQQHGNTTCEQRQPKAEDVQEVRGNPPAK
jgi:hypothetical protein